MSAIEIDVNAYREKVLGCWLGKAVGGTLGGPYEGQDGPLALTYYDPLPDRMLPNDDLDLQVVWLETIRRHGLPVDRRTLVDAWLAHVHLWPDEYGVACRNLAQGLYPPISGWYDNGFTAGMGAAIRTEIWACLAPGDPQLAATLALEDACVDHAGEGVYAALYLAALESAAFVAGDCERLLDIAGDTIPSDCRVARAIADTRQWWAGSGDWQDVRLRILAEHGRQNFTDVAQNLAFIVLGWLAGGGEFDAALCTAVNCGKDTDCTGATLGALLGILSPEAIDQKWLKPIGRNLVLSPGMVGTHPPATLDALTDQVTELAVQVLRYYDSDVTLTDGLLIPESWAGVAAPRHRRHDGIALQSLAPHTESLVATQPLVVHVMYPPQGALAPASPSEIGLRILNPTARRLVLNLHAHVPEGWWLDRPHRELNLDPGQAESFSLRITPPPADAPRVYRNPLDLDFECEGLRWTVTAGLVTTFPWRRWPVEALPAICPPVPEGAETTEVAGHFQPLSAGPCALTSDFKQPYHKTIRVVVQCPRQVRVWLDGTEILSHDGDWLVPAIHRSRETGVDCCVARGWHRLTVAVSSGDDDDLFVGIGDGESWKWLGDVEWRMPSAP
jgi:ADP-ribosylglycohydrolase